MSEKKDQLLIYRSPRGNTEIEVNIDGDTVWLSINQIADLFQTSKQNISLHLKNIYDQKELLPEATVKENLTVQKEGGRDVKREIQYYNLDAIISIGYRVNSIQGTHFRIWATQQLNQLMVKGFVLDDEKLKGIKSNYFDELQERVRAIRLSEKNFWQKIRDIFAFGSMDYEPNSEIAKTFFATVQNMFHYAIHQHTASEVLKERADAYKDNMGLYTWAGAEITKADVFVAKNYLTELELKRLNLLADQFLSFAELQSVERRPMYMATWISKLIEFLKLNEKPILTDKGKVSAEVGKQIAMKEFERFENIRREQSKGLKEFLKKNLSDENLEQLAEADQEIKAKFQDASFGKILGAVSRAGKPEK